MEEQYESLKLKSQLCFPLYAAAKEIIRLYRPYLEELDLTYTQYIAMMILWARESVTAKELGEILFLDSGTLTPLLKKLEAKGLISRRRDQDDERSLIVSLTPEGDALRDRAVEVPEKMARCVRLSPEEALQLYKLLYKLLG
jgi:DNA-binding MarR family transcriptional regulator